MAMYEARIRYTARAVFVTQERVEAAIAVTTVERENREPLGRLQLSLLLTTCTLERDPIRQLLGNITKQGELVVPAPVRRHHQHDPSDETDQTHDPAEPEERKGEEAAYPPQDAHRPEEQDRLRGVEADKAIVPLEQEEDQASHPAEEVAEQSGGSDLHAHRRSLAGVHIPWCPHAIRLLVPVLLLPSLIVRRIGLTSRVVLLLVATLRVRPFTIL